MKHPQIRHEPPKKKPKPPVHFRAHEYLPHRDRYVQNSLDRLFGIEKTGAVGRV